MISVGVLIIWLLGLITGAVVGAFIAHEVAAKRRDSTTVEVHEQTHKAVLARQIADRYTTSAVRACEDLTSRPVLSFDLSRLNRVRASIGLSPLTSEGGTQ